MELQDTYQSIKPQIDKRLAEFKHSWFKNKHQAVFTELIFCLCTPQTDAHKGWAAAWRVVEAMKEKPLTEAAIAHILKFCGVRFHKTKAKRIHQAIGLYYPRTKQWLSSGAFDEDGGMPEARDYLASEVAGLGMKEASHFLRNIGFGQDIVILDRHILRNLVKYSVLSELPKRLKKKTYREVEQKMIDFAHSINIPVLALDMVFWYNAKKEVFK